MRCVCGGPPASARWFCTLNILQICHSFTLWHHMFFSWTSALQTKSEEILLLLIAAPPNFLGMALDVVPPHLFDSLYSPLDRI